MADDNAEVNAGATEVSSAMAEKLASIHRATGQESSLEFQVKQPAEGEQPVGQQPVGEQPVGEQPVGEQPAGEQPVGEQPVGEQPAAETKDPLSLADEVSKMNSKITGEINLTEDPPPSGEPHKGFEKWEDFEKFITDVGYDGITKENAQEKLTEIFETSKKFAEVDQKLKNYDLVLENLPQDLMAGIQAWADGKDYRAQMNSVPSFDYSKKFEDHNPKNLIEKYFPGQITEEEWAESNEDDAEPQVKAKISTYQDLVKKKYELDQAEFNQRKKAYEDGAKETLAQRQQTFDKSRQYFPKAFESASGFPVKDDYVSEVDKNLKDQSAVLSVFFNPDGSYKEDAHYRMAMALDGGEFVEQQAARLKNKLVTQARAEVIKDTPEAAAIKKTGDQTQLSDAEKSQQRIKGYVNKVLPTTDEKIY